MGDPHLIRRHGGWFRPGAHGYTLDLAAAGVFPGDQARLYLDVEGLTIHPLHEVLVHLETDVAAKRASLSRAEATLAEWTALGTPTPTQESHDGE